MVSILERGEQVPLTRSRLEECDGAAADIFICQVQQMVLVLFYLRRLAAIVNIKDDKKRSLAAFSSGSLSLKHIICIE